jgi:nuclease S1
MKLHAVKRNRIVCAAAGLLILAIEAPARVHAWGGQGHRLVAQIAAERLTIVARQNVVWLLGSETLADVSSWADRYVDANYQTFYWHFLNIPPDAASYDRDRDCQVQPTVVAGTRADKWRDCAVDRVLYNEERLADTSLDRADRAIALKFLVHLIGDLHQPFHALGVEHGGNGIAVSVFGSETCGINPCNLHGVWDSALITHASLDDAAFVSKLDAEIRQNGWDSQPEGVPAEWAIDRKSVV